MASTDIKYNRIEKPIRAIKASILYRFLSKISLKAKQGCKALYSYQFRTS